MHTKQLRKSFATFIFAVFAAVFLTAGSCSSEFAGVSVIEGTAMTAGSPLADAEVTIYSSASGGRNLATTRTDRDGKFKLEYVAPGNSQSVVYLTTKGGKVGSIGPTVPSEFVLALVIGPSPYAETVVLNELTTVASAFALAQFISSNSIQGPAPGLQIASKMLRNLVEIDTGNPGATISNSDNEPGSTYSALKTLNEMANLLASCATNANVCQSIVQLALPLNGPAPADVFRAAVNMAAVPWNDPAPLFNLVTADAYQPDLGPEVPSAWTLALKFKGNPTNLAGPGNMAFDADGQMWIVNNLVTDETYILPDCASQLLFRMDPATGIVDTFTGGGVLGAGYGVGIAAGSGDIWVGNYGFKGSTCPINIANNSVSQFAPDGTALSPEAQNFDPLAHNPQDGGWTNGGIGWAQGTVSNTAGDIWIASCNGNLIDDEQVDVTIYRNADPDDWQAISEDNFEKPFDIAFDLDSNAWVSGTNSDNIMAFAPDGTKLREYALGTSAKPMGVASDSFGNIWISLSGRIDLPCPPPLPSTPTATAPGIAMVNLDGVQLNTRPDPAPADYEPPGGITIPWGIAVDGNDNVWVANFTTGGVSHFCGADVTSCPASVQTGDALSPADTGYHSDLLDRNTGVEIDSSGNVWLANNWKQIPIQPDPVGDGMVVYIGLAKPVKGPLIGTPEQP